MKNTFSDFLILQKATINLIKEKKYEEAIIYLENAKNVFPDKVDRIGHWLSGIYCIQSNKKKALSELKEVVDKGLYWNPSILTTDTYLSFIQGSEEFSEIVQRSEKIYNSRKRNSSSSLLTLGNKEAETSITALHWKNSNAMDFSEQIITDGLKDKYLFSFVQSSQLFSNGCYHWDKYDVAKTDIEKRMEDDRGTAIKNRILFGASQGADTAIEVYFEPNENYDKVIALVPTLSDFHRIEEKLKNHQKSNVNMVIITGDKDYFYNNVLDAVPVFEKYNIPCKLIVMKGMGHAIPDNFEKLLEENIK